MEEIKRVFFHELGHFIAHEINRKFYHGTGTKSIVIYPANGNSDLFLGEAIINLSEDEREKNAPFREILPEYLASSTYGCIFQSYYLGTSLNDCFKQNGHDDSKKWHDSLGAHGLDHLRAEISTAEKEYFELLKQEKALDEMMVFNSETYLVNLGNENYNVDINQLSIDSASFVDKHKEMYKILINKYLQIL
jgi:hypothetical protein